MIILNEVTAPNNTYIELANRAVEILNNTLLTQSFKNGVLRASFTETDLSNEEIYDLMISDIKIDVVFFYGSFLENRIWKTVGKEIGDGKVYANTYFIKKNHAVKLGSLILHETSHIKGFHHYKTKLTSVPYQMNKIFEVLND